MNKNILTILEHLKIINKEQIIIAIDGMSGSGKSTYAKAISERVSATVIHMDDYFLRPEQRTEERLNTPGGNVDVERLISEVIVPASKGEAFTYKPFDCHTMSFKEAKIIKPEKLIILEGSYSCHPSLFSYSDLHVFLTTDRLTQIKRILLRSGYEKTHIFIDKWIPLENRYFDYYEISERCELKFFT